MRFVAIALIVGCGHSSPPRQDPIARTPDAGVTAPAGSGSDSERAIAGVQLTVTPAEAEVVIDGTSFGVASMRVIPLEPGLHQLVVRLDGYKPFRVELTVANKTEHLTVRLEPIPTTNRN